MGRQAGFFDIDERLMRLSDLGDQLEGFRAAVDFEIFRANPMAIAAVERKLQIISEAAIPAAVTPVSPHPGHSAQYCRFPAPP